MNLLLSNIKSVINLVSIYTYKKYVIICIYVYKLCNYLFLSRKICEGYKIHGYSCHEINMGNCLEEMIEVPGPRLSDIGGSLQPEKNLTLNF